MRVEQDGPQSDICRRWIVTYGERRYRVEWAWSGGSQRMEWDVYVEVSPPQVQTHYRRIRGNWLINAVKAHENALHKSPT